MATTKKVTQVTGGTSSASQTTSRSFVPTPESKAKATKLRIISVILWILGIAAEAGAIFALIKLSQPLDNKAWALLIGLIVIDAVLVIIGSQLWKKANRLDPASKKEPIRFFLQNQLGVIIAVIAFLPLVVFIFTNKNLDRKSKGILGGIAAIALVVAGLWSADFNPPSVEEYSEQTNRVEWLNDGNNQVYWTKSGTVYHLYDDCSHINSNRTDEIFQGTVAQARELKKITNLCKSCEKRAIAERGLKEEDYKPAIEAVEGKISELTE
jgi:hypothetical protein